MTNDTSLVQQSNKKSSTTPSQGWNRFLLVKNSTFWKIVKILKENFPFSNHEGAAVAANNESNTPSRLALMGIGTELPLVVKKLGRLESAEDISWPDRTAQPEAVHLLKSEILSISHINVQPFLMINKNIL